MHLKKMQNMEKFTYWDNPLNRSNISHKSEVCDQFFFPEQYTRGLGAQ